MFFCFFVNVNCQSLCQGVKGEKMADFSEIGSSGLICSSEMSLNKL